MTAVIDNDPALGESIARLARQVKQLEQRRACLDELGDLVGELTASQLVPVVGEQNLERELRQMIADAHQLIGDLANVDLDDVDGALRRFSDIVNAPAWELERDITMRLRAKREKVQDFIATMNSRLVTLQVAVVESWRALDDARVYGVVDPEQQARTSAVEGLVKQARIDAAQQRYGHVALALAQVEKIGDLGATQGKLTERLAQAQERVGSVVKHSELVLIRSESLDDVLEYTALLRIPRSDVQRVDLSASSVLVVRDRSELAQIVHDVATIVQRNVRSARSASRNSVQDASVADSGVADSGVADSSVQALDPGPTRRFAESDPPVTATSGIPDDVVDQLTDVGQRLYTLFLPDKMQRLLDEARGSLVVTTNDLELPWELLHDGDEFLCLQRPMARMPLGRSLPRRSHRCPSNSDGRKLRILLVASDPFDDLPGPGVEVETVRRRLQKGYGDAVHIECLVGPDATGAALNDRLRSAAFHVVHYAGHAAFDKVRPERSRLLVHGSRPNTAEPFFAQKIERLMEGSPLVFLNACESSTTANERQENSSAYFAEETQGLASAFLYGGAAACVGSLWPVFDDTAAELAATFYERLFEGLSVGEALRQARDEVRKGSTDKVTWAAYALYGDPQFELPLHPRSTADRLTRLPAD